MSNSPSRQSIGSHPSRFQRTSQSRKSLVDETLFGSPVRGLNIQKYGSNTITNEEISRIRALAEQGKQKDAVILSKDEFNRLKASSIMNSQQLASQAQSAFQTHKEQKLRESKIIRQRYQTMDLSRKEAEGYKELNSDQKLRTNPIMRAALERLDEQHDEVKHMNQLVLQSKVATIRERQLEENKLLEEQYIQGQKKIDQMMEIERLKAGRLQDEREERKRQMVKAGGQVLIEQIKEKNFLRLKDQELKDREMFMMLRQQEQIKQEAIKQQERKMQTIRQAQDEVYKSNDAALLVKQQKLKEEQEIERKIAEFNKQKDQREEQRQQEELIQKQIKEMEIKRLRDLQERAQDEKAQKDQERAQRHQDEYFKRQREKEQREIEKKQKMLKELEDERQKQKQDQALVKTQQVQFEQNMYQKMVQKMKQDEEHDKFQSAEKKRAYQQNSYGVYEQMQEREMKKQQEQMAKHEESRKLKQEQEYERRKILEIKQQKIEHLQNLDIPHKFQTDLIKKKILF